MNTQLPLWEQRLRQIAIFAGRIVLAYLFFTQLFWKMPPTFNCPPDFTFTTADAQGKLVRTSGLCDWIGIEAVWSQRPHPILAANIDNRGAAELAANIGWASRLNGVFIQQIVEPNIRWFGWVIWLTEAGIFVSLFFGIFSRFGALVAIGQTTQLLVGLAGISNPYEWEWSYNLMVVLAFMMFAFAPGRVFGIDTWLRPRLQARATAGNGLARVLLWLT